MLPYARVAGAVAAESIGGFAELLRQALACSSAVLVEKSTHSSESVESSRLCASVSLTPRYVYVTAIYMDVGLRSC